ncbi:MAG: hypothetical protein QM673_17050, partial [Gordonia sp. (in: high G+C Gram-positive bacteria)]
IRRDSPDPARHRLGAENQARMRLHRVVDELAATQHVTGIGTAARWRTLLGMAVIGALVIGAVMFAAFRVGSAISASHTPSDIEYRRAAADAMVLLLGPDTADPDRSHRILDHATGDFYDEFGQSATAYTEFVRRNGTVARAVIDATAVSERAGANVAVLVVATVTYARARPQHSTATVLPTRHFRLRVGVVAVDGTLKVEAVHYLP